MEPFPDRRVPNRKADERVIELAGRGMARSRNDEDPNSRKSWSPLAAREYDLQVRFERGRETGWWVTWTLGMKGVCGWEHRVTEHGEDGGTSK